VKGGWEITAEIQVRFGKKGIRSPTSTAIGRAEWELVNKMVERRCFAVR
jgi:hypothetical protein